MCEINGQISFMDMLQKEEQEKAEAGIPVLFHSGDILYVVNKADVRKCTVLDEKPWMIHENTSRGYRIQFENGCYGVITNESLNQNVFFSKEEAEAVAEQYAEAYEVIQAKDIEMKNVEAYAYIRECDGHRLTAFLGEIGNGMLYIKDFMTYAHIVKDTPKTRKAFVERIQQEQNWHKNFERTDCLPAIKNMYPCPEEKDWLYAEAEYTGTYNRRRADGEKETE